MTGKAAILFFVLAAAAAEAYEISVPKGELTLKGRVTFAPRGDHVFFMETDDAQYWRCAHPQERFRLDVSDRVEVSGEVLHKTVNNRLDNCRVKKLPGDSGNAKPPCEAVSIAQLNAHPASGSSEPDRFARIVSVSGRVVDVNRRVDAVQIVLADGEKCVGVSFRMNALEPLPDGLSIGSIVRVKGVYVYVTLPKNSPHPEFTGIAEPLVMLASPSDLEVLTHPPFWTPPRIAVASALAAFVAFGLVFWVVSLRRTVARQIKVIERALKEKAAQDGARRERLRLSHDLHDDFQQLLSGAMFRITAALNWLEEGNAEKMRSQLESARSTIMHTQSQLRTVLWGLQEESEGPGSLVALIRYAAGRMAHWEGIVRISSTGRESPLARTVAGGLLMILQEAVGNAISHGRATRVDVSVGFDDGSLSLSVDDNGTGFDVMRHNRGLGLGSMEERARALGGTLRIESAPGRGTSIKVEIPL